MKNVEEKEITKKQETIKLNKFQTYLIYFFLYSFIGWTLETFYSLLVLGHFTNRGFLFGPICPIYGYGVLILIIFLSKYKKSSLKLFIISAIVFSSFEYLVSFGLDALFAMHWWDYTQDFLNLNGRISIFYTIAWGVFAILLLNHMHPFFENKINWILSKIPYTAQRIILYILFCSYVFDTIVSSVWYVI